MVVFSCGGRGRPKGGEGSGGGGGADTGSKASMFFSLTSSEGLDVLFADLEKGLAESDFLEAGEDVRELPEVQDIRRALADLAPCQLPSPPLDCFQWDCEEANLTHLFFRNECDDAALHLADAFGVETNPTRRARAWLRTTQKLFNDDGSRTKMIVERAGTLARKRKWTQVRDDEAEVKATMSELQVFGTEELWNLRKLYDMATAEDFFAAAFDSQAETTTSTVSNGSEPAAFFTPEEDDKVQECIHVIEATLDAIDGAAIELGQRTGILSFDDEDRIEKKKVPLNPSQDRTRQDKTRQDNHKTRQDNHKTR